jgi:2-deoxy-D-gluconate 3-dehydrogenase
MNFDLENKVAIVTGASRGLGMAAARSLAAEGCKILAAARSVEDLQNFESELPDSIRACPCDMTDIGAVRSLPARAVEEFGRLDIVVNNAGIAPAGLFLDQDDRVWDEVFAINVTAPAMLAKEAARIMVRQGSGKIINVASTSGILGKRFLVAYSASKGAVLQFTKALAGELARECNCAGRLRYRCTTSGARIA